MKKKKEDGSILSLTNILKFRKYLKNNKILNYWKGGGFKIQFKLVGKHSNALVISALQCMNLNILYSNIVNRMERRRRTNW